MPPAFYTAWGLAQASPLPMLLWWGEELNPRCNAAFTQFLPSAPAKADLQPAAWGEAWAQVSADIAEVMHSGRAVWRENCALPLPHTPSGEFFATYSYNPVFDGNSVAGVLLICSRHYRASTVRSDGRFGYAAVIHSMDMGFAIVEAVDTPPGQLLDYRYVEVNQAWEAQTGFRNAVGKRATELVKEREPFWPQTIEKVITTGTPVRSTVKVKAWNITVDVLAMRLGGPGSRQVAMLARNVTEESKAVDALQQSEQRARAEAERAEAERNRLNAVLEATPALVFVVDANHGFIRANSRAREEWGDHPKAGSAKWMGWWADGTKRHGRRLARTDWPLARALQGEVSRELIEIAAPNNASIRKTYIVSGAPIWGQSSVEGAVVAAMDITDRIRAEQALQDAHQRKDEFLAMLAHELRNPLAPIGAAAELMSRPSANKELMLRTSAIIARQVRHMTGLVDDLLDMSRVNRGAITLDKEYLDTNSVMDDAIEQIAPLLRSKRHRLDIHRPTQPLLFEGDRKRVVQVLSNLLNNAIRYTPNGGRLQLCIDLVDGWVEIRVSDNGQGMDEATLARAFDLFVQAKRSADRQQGGLGIGLALVKKLVELHGGSVHAASEGIGRGSEFTVRLPTSGQAMLPVETSPRPVKPAAVNLRVMVVDDHVDAATTLGMLIEAEGYACEVVHEPELALARTASAGPDVFVLDIGLPRMDGRELARQLRARPATAGALLIALSGYAQPEDQQAALDAGFDHYLVKPVDSSRLMELLAGRAQSRRLAA